MPVIKNLSDAVGTIKFLPTSVAVNGYLVCDGSTVSTTTFAALFAVISTTYNSGGEPGGTFRLPDMRGKTAIGSGQDNIRDLSGTGSGSTNRALGSYAGAETATITTANLPLHTHTATTNTQSANHTHPASLNSQSNNISSQSMDGHVHSYTFTNNANDSDAGGGKASPAGTSVVGSGPSGSLDHSHSFTTGGPSANHNHTFTTNSGDSLGSGSHNNIQPGLVGGGFYVKY